MVSFFWNFKFCLQNIKNVNKVCFLLNKIVVTFYKQISILTKNIQIAFLNGFFL